MSIPSGMLIEKYNEKKMMVVAFIVAFSVHCYWPYFQIILQLFCLCLLIGCGMAMLQVVINPLLRTAGGEEHYAFNSVLAQLIFGGASFLSPLVYSYMVMNLNNDNGQVTFSLFHPLFLPDLPWISLYWLFAVICILMIIVISVSKFPKVELSSEEKAGR